MASQIPIVWLCEYAELHGAERSLLATLDYVRTAGFEINAIAPPSGPLADELDRAGLKVHPLPEGDRDDRRAMLTALFVSLRPALVHANSLAMGRVCGPVVAGLSIPSVCHLRDIVRLSAAAVDDLNCHTRLLAVSQATAEFHRGQGIDALRLHVLHNGVDLEHLAPRRPTGFLHRQLQLPSGARLLGAIGQIGIRKGWDVLFDALPGIFQAAPNAHLVLVGQRTSGKEESRHFEDRLRARVTKTPLAGRVHWLGVISDVAVLLNELTLLVHPARQEPLGRVLLEAAAAGCAIVATDVGGTREIFCGPDSAVLAESAVLIPPDDAAALAQAVISILADQVRRDRLGQAARRSAVQAFDIRATARGLVAQYHAVLGQRT